MGNQFFIHQFFIQFLNLKKTIIDYKLDDTKITLSKKQAVGIPA
jgi:hypothetical protein